MSRFQRSVGDMDEARRTHINALRILTRLAQAPEADATIKIMHASAHIAHGYFLSETDNSLTLHHVEQARSIIDEVHRRFGETPASWRVLGHVHLLAGKAQQEQVAIAQREYERSCVVFEEVKKSQPNEIDVLHDLGMAYLERGVVETTSLGHRRFMLKAMDNFQARLKLQPGDPGALIDVAHCQAALACTNDCIEVPLETALNHAMESTKITSQLIKEYPSTNEFRRVQALALYYAGSRALVLQRSSQALELLQACRNQWEYLAQHEPGIPQFSSFVARTNILLGDAHVALGKPPAAVTVYQEAIQQLRAPALMQFSASRTKYYLGRALRRLGAVELSQGKYSQAGEHLLKAKDLFTALQGKLDNHAQFYVDQAACYALLARLAAIPNSGITADQEQRYSLLALDCLRYRTEDYQPHPSLLEIDHAFDGLRSSPDFQKLMKKLTEEAGRVKN
ncbi:MAG: hypothetical protein QM703_29035 [Gemmatales bacterium]